MKLIELALSKGGTGKIGCPVFASVAGKAGCSSATLYMIALGHKLASAKLAARIATATEGQVARHDLRPDVFGPVLVTSDRQAIAALVDTRMSKRALRTKFGFKTDAPLAKLLKLPLEQVEAWPEEQSVPALPQVLRLLGVQETPPAAEAAPSDPDVDRIINVEAA